MIALKTRKATLYNMELVDVVNEKGEFTGQVVARDVARRKHLPHWEVVVFIINDKGEMLLQKRSANKKYNPNKWAPLSGGVVAGESLIAATKRELKEELGILVHDYDLHVLEENANLTRIYYMKCNYNPKDFTIQKEELSEVKWFDIDDVIKMIMKHDDSIIIKENRTPLLHKLKTFAN